MAKLVQTVAFLFVACLALAYGQSQNEIQDIEKKVKDQFKEQFPQIENFNTSMLPIEQAEAVARAKCEKNGGPDAYDNLKSKKDSLATCFNGFVDMATLQKELDDAATTGSMELVFGKYCALYPDQVKGCMDELKEALLPCMEEEEKPTIEKMFNVTDKIVTFSCDKKGDRMAMFYAEGGMECLNKSRPALLNCMNTTFGEEIIAMVPMFMGAEDENLTLPLIVLKEEHSTKYDLLHDCVRSALENCDQSTPANVVDALFKYVRRLLFVGKPSSATVPVIGTLLVICASLFVKYL